MLQEFRGMEEGIWKLKEFLIASIFQFLKSVGYFRVGQEDLWKLEWGGGLMLPLWEPVKEWQGWVGVLLGHVRWQVQKK